MNKKEQESYKPYKATHDRKNRDRKDQNFQKKQNHDADTLQLENLKRDATSYQKTLRTATHWLSARVPILYDNHKKSALIKSSGFFVPMLAVVRDFLHPSTRAYLRASRKAADAAYQKKQEAAEKLQELFDYKCKLLNRLKDRYDLSDTQFDQLTTMFEKFKTKGEVTGEFRHLKSAFEELNKLLHDNPPRTYEDRCGMFREELLAKLEVHGPKFLDLVRDTLETYPSLNNHSEEFAGLIIDLGGAWEATDPVCAVAYIATYLVGIPLNFLVRHAQPYKDNLSNMTLGFDDLYKVGSGLVTLFLYCLFFLFLLWLLLEIAFRWLNRRERFEEARKRAWERRRPPRRRTGGVLEDPEELDLLNPNMTVYSPGAWAEFFEEKWAKWKRAVK